MANFQQVQQTRLTAASRKSLYTGLTGIEKQLEEVNDEVQAARKDYDSLVDKMKQDLDSMSEMDSLRLQMAMDRLSKMMSTLSNLLKKISDTQNSITQNLK